MERVEIRYDKGKLFKAIIPLGLGLLGATVIVFFTDVFYSNHVLAKLRIIGETLVVLADAYLIYTLIKKRQRFTDAPALILTSNTIEINEDGQYTIFHAADMIKANVTKKKIGETDIDVLVVSDNSKSKEINIYPLDKSLAELQVLMKRFS